MAAVLAVTIVGACGGDSGDDGGGAEPPAAAELQLEEGTPRPGNLRIEGKARRRWPDTFAGVWGGPGDSVQIAFTEGAEEKVAELADGYAQPELLLPETAEHSLAELEAIQEAMVDDRVRAGRGELELRNVPRSFASGIDVRANAVVVYVEEASPEAIEAFTSRYGDELSFEEGPLPTPDHPEAEVPQ